MARQRRAAPPPTPGREFRAIAAHRSKSTCIPSARPDASGPKRLRSRHPLATDFVGSVDSHGGRDQRAFRCSRQLRAGLPNVTEPALEPQAAHDWCGLADSGEATRPGQRCGRTDDQRDQRGAREPVGHLDTYDLDLDALAQILVHLSLIHISEPTRPMKESRKPSSA